MVYTLSDGTQSTRRKSVILTGGSDGVLSNYQLKLTTAHSDAMQADFDCLRFVNDDFSALVDAWLESKTDSNTADIWAEFPATPADGVEETKAYMYYGNADAVSDWDIGATFVFGDDFPGSSLDGGKWGSSGTITVASSEATLDADDSIKSISTFGYGHAVKAKVKADEQDSVFIKFGNNYAVGTGDALELYNTDYSNTDNFDSFSCSKVLSGTASITLVDGKLDFRNVYRTYEITRESTSAKYYQDDNLLYTHNNSGNWPTGNLNIGMNVWDSSQASTLISDWIFVRKFVSNPPTYAFGTEEHQRRTPIMM